MAIIIEARSLENFYSFEEAVESVLHNELYPGRPEFDEMRPFQIEFKLNEVPEVKHPLGISGVPAEIRKGPNGEQWEVDYEFTLARMDVQNTSKPFYEPHLNVSVLVDVRVLRIRRLFLRERPIKDQFLAFKQRNAQREEIREWARRFADEVEETFTEDEDVISDLIYGKGDTWQEALDYAYDQAAQP